LGHGALLILVAMVMIIKQTQQKQKLMFVTGSRAQRTEKGSHASEGVHLAGIESSPTDHIVQLFCMKMTFPKESDYNWLPGLFTVTSL